jgi:hypothetical protein
MTHLLNKRSITSQLTQLMNTAILRKKESVMAIIIGWIRTETHRAKTKKMNHSYSCR